MNGNLLWLGEGHEIAIYQRDGVSWIADFRGGRGELFTAGEWFALNARGSVLRRAAQASNVPLPAHAIERIERLHRAQDRAPFAALAARLRDCLAALSRELCASAVALSPRR